MTRDEIMAMGEQALCDWLYQKEVLFRVGADEQEMLKFRGKWNLPACAFAARDHVCSKSIETTGQWINTVIKLAQCGAATADEIDWLLAAAIVITEQGSSQ
jgi:phage antirepressor YoqD-like protein